MNWSVISPQEPSNTKKKKKKKKPEINNTQGQELSTKWTSPHYFHKPPTPTCRLQISFSFRAARCSLPCVLITITLRPGKVKREHRDPLPRVLHQDPEAWEFYPGERKQELASQIHLPPWEAVFNCSLKSLSKLFKVLSAHSGKFCWAPRAAVVSSLLSITGAATLGRVPIFHCLPGMVPHRQLTWLCHGDSRDLFPDKCWAIHLAFSTYHWWICVNDFFPPVFFKSVISIFLTAFEEVCRFMLVKFQPKEPFWHKMMTGQWSYYFSPQSIKS